MFYISDELKEELKFRTGGLLKETNEEIQLFCPYCDDAYRRPNPKWGHLYIGKENLLFYCHRCGAKGHIVKLLRDLGISPSKYFSREIVSLNLNSVIKEKSLAQKEQFNFKSNNLFLFLREKEKFSDEINYIIKRTGINYEIFFPMYGISIFEKNKIHFFNKDEKNKIEIVLYRNLQETNNDGKKLPKYFKISKNKNFMLKRVFNFLDLERIIFSEGTFDTINLFRNLKFKNSLFVSVQGSYYQKIFETYFLKFPFVNEFHFFLDKDINEKKLFFRLRFILDKIVKNIKIENKKKIIFYKNPKFKDYGEINFFDYKKIFEIDF